MEYEDYLNFTPESKSVTLLKSVMDLYISDGLDYNVKFIIKTEGISKFSWNDKRIKLGQSMWLGRPQSATITYEYKYEQLYQYPNSIRK